MTCHTPCDGSPNTRPVGGAFPQIRLEIAMAWTQQEINDNARTLYAAFIRSQGIVMRKNKQEISAFIDYLTQAIGVFMFKDVDMTTGEPDEVSVGIAGAWASLMNVVALGGAGRPVEWKRLYWELRTIVPQIEIAEIQAKGLAEKGQDEAYFLTYGALLGKPSRKNQDVAAA